MPNAFSTKRGLYSERPTVLEVLQGGKMTRPRRPEPVNIGFSDAGRQPDSPSWRVPPGAQGDLFLHQAAAPRGRILPTRSGPCEQNGRPQ